MEDNKNEVIVKCDCNCSCMSVDYWEEDDLEKQYFITYYNSYEGSTFLSKLKDIWKIIRGKRIYNSDLVLSEKEFNKIRNFMKKDTFHGL
jgi:hypothetical protein